MKTLVARFVFVCNGGEKLVTLDSLIIFAIIIYNADCKKFVNSCIASIIFDGSKYSEALIQSFASAYKQVVEQFFSKEKISDIGWLSAVELAKVQNIHDTDWKVAERPAYRKLFS